MLEIGTKLYNQGDMANEASEGIILESNVDNKFGNHYIVKFDSRKTTTRIEASMVKTCTLEGIGNGFFRIVTLASYYEARAKKIELMKK